VIDQAYQGDSIFDALANAARAREEDALTYSQNYRRGWTVLECSVMKKIIAFSLLSIAFCFGNSPVPFAGERYQIDQIYKAVAEPALRAEAVGLLTAIARAEDMSAVPTLSLKSAGVPLELMTSHYLHNPTVRAFAVQRLSESGLAEVRPTLERLAIVSDPADTSLEVRTAAAIGRWTLKLNGVDSATKLGLLKAALSDRSAGSSVPSWAADELCETGDPRALRPALDSIDQVWGPQAGPQKRLCERKVELLSAYPNRPQAYRHALWDSRFEDEVKVWALLGLARLRTPDATAELESYATFLEGVGDAGSSLRVAVANALGKPPR